MKIEKYLIKEAKSMKKCIRCQSDRILSLSGKTSDSYSHTYKGKYYDGYVPNGIGIGGGDEIEFMYCLKCGQIQDKFPINDKDYD
jgi:hypothetical protein